MAEPRTSFRRFATSSSRSRCWCCDVMLATRGQSSTSTRSTVDAVKALEDCFDIEISDDDLKLIEFVGAAIKLNDAPRRCQGGLAGAAPGASTHPGEHVDIAIVGRGVVTSIAEGADASSTPRSTVSRASSRWRSCSDFDPTSAMTPKAARRSDRDTQLAVAAAAQATEEAGLPGTADPQAPRGAHGQASAG